MDLSNLKIKSQSDLKQLLKFLEGQGFGYFSDWELHQKKVQNLINKNNTLHITYEKDLPSKFTKLEDYDTIDEEIKKYFSKFNVSDKIQEFTKTFYLQDDDSCQTPYASPDAKSVIAWVEFKDRYNLKDEFGAGKQLDYYNLDKNFLKIYFPQYKGWEFKSFYKTIFNEDCKEFEEKEIGKWQNLGKIEIKFFAKGTAAIKGDLKKIKESYYNYIVKNRYRNLIIKYNSKIEIIKAPERD
jgi:hypothetical protein